MTGSGAGPRFLKADLHIPPSQNLFKAKSKAATKQELMMFLTPHIVKAPAQLAGMSTTEMNQTSIVTNSVSEQELDRFLERVPVKPMK